MDAEYSYYIKLKHYSQKVIMINHENGFGKMPLITKV